MPFLTPLNLSTYPDFYIFLKRGLNTRSLEKEKKSDHSKGKLFWKNSKKNVFFEKVHFLTNFTKSNIFVSLPR